MRAGDDGRLWISTIPSAYYLELSQKFYKHIVQGEFDACLPLLHSSLKVESTLSALKDLRARLGANGTTLVSATPQGKLGPTVNLEGQGQCTFTLVLKFTDGKQKIADVTWTFYPFRGAIFAFHVR